MIRTRHNSEHYNWGEECSGWYLVKSPGMSVVEEVMPPGTEEQLHFHQKAEQFFYIQKGVAVFEMENEIFSVSAGKGFNVKPGMTHRIKNCTESSLEFIVTSCPSTIGDRINL